MPFLLNPASLVDQPSLGYSHLVLPDSVSPSTILTQNSTNLTIPQIFVVNPSSDNIFRHVDPQSAHAAIIGLIYFSMWMGALGWDIVSTISFDVRLIKETTWSSSFSCIYSISYLLSRYISLSWLVTAVTNSVIMTDRCDAWMKGSTALFSIAISATMLVFCLRACSIWHMHQKVVSLVVSAWFLVVAFAVLLPVMSRGTQLPTSNFCAWHFNGLYVVGVFGALLTFDLLCLIVTVCKLNKAGWRGLLHGLFPSSRHNLDSEDVKTMLVQKTTAFFAIQFLFLISALLVYVLTDTYAYRMMNIVASVAVASSMAGRIFRRAWRQTRELAPHNINRPPSYFPAWAEEHRDAAVSRADLHSVYTSGNDTGDGGRIESAAAKLARMHRNKDKHDSLAFYVEGEYRPQLKARTLSDQSLRSNPRTPTSVGPTQQMREMEAGQAGLDAATDTVSISPSTIVIARDNLTVPSQRGSTPLRRDSRASQSGPAPAYSTRLGSAASSRPRTGEQQGPAGASVARPNSAGQSSSRASSFLAASISEREAAALAQQDDLDSDDARSVVMEEKRRAFIASPPLSAAGLKLNRKEVYDFDSVKAAAHLGTAQAHLRKSSSRPATASLVPPAGSGFESAGIAFGLASPGRVQFASAAQPDANLRCASGGSAGSSDGKPFAILDEGQLAQDHQRSPRPKTAPNWPSPSSSASDSGASQVTLRPRGFAAQAERFDLGLPASAGASSAVAAAEDALFAFLHTVEQDSRDRDASHPHELQTPSAKTLVDADLATDEGRPRTSRGNTASSRKSSDTVAEPGSDVKQPLGNDPDVRGRRASSPARPGPGVSARDKNSSQRRGSSSTGVRTRAGISDDSGSGNRPSTAVGDAVKPFGYGSSSRGGSQANVSRDAASWISDDEEGEAEAELGSVIQREYAKLAARAQLPLD